MMFIPSGGEQIWGQLELWLQMLALSQPAVARGLVGRVPRQLQNLSQGFEAPTVQVRVCHGCGLKELHSVVFGVCYDA
jgi:hypothetical protein